MSDAHRWRSELLGRPRTLRLGEGGIELFERGEGPALVFCHGWLAKRQSLAQGRRPALRRVPLPLPRPAARLASHTDDGIGGRVSRLVLTSCETPYDEWPPSPFDGLPAAARDEDALGKLLGALEDPAVRTLPAAYGLLLKHPVETEVSDSYALPASRDAGVLRDVAKAMVSTTTDPVREAGKKLIAESEMPTLLIWSRDDEVFPLAHAERYAGALKAGRLVAIDDAYGFTPEDQPAAVAAAIRTFAA